MVATVNLRVMGECIYCGGGGCPYCMPVEPLIANYYVFDDVLNDYRRCSEEEYNQADEESRMKTYK